MSHLSLAVKISNDLELHELISNATNCNEIADAAMEVAENSGLTGKHAYCFALGYLSNHIAEANK